VLANLIQVRVKAKDAPPGHKATGTVRANQADAHPGDTITVIVEVAFEGGAPAGGLSVGCSPPEDFTAGEPGVEVRPEGATVTIPVSIAQTAELGRYYAQVVYSDATKEHFEAEYAIEVAKHWVTIESISTVPPRAAPGDAVDVVVRMTFGGEGRVRGHAKGRVAPEGWGGDEEQVLQLTKERGSVTTEREMVWHVRIPREAKLGPYMATVEFSSGEGKEERTVPKVLLVVPRRAMGVDVPSVEPAIIAPSEPFVLRARFENTGLEPLDVRAGGELAPEAGGSAVPLDERVLALAPAAVSEVSWGLTAPERIGRWLCRVRGRADRTEGADPAPAVLDVRPPHLPQALAVVPAQHWAGPGEEVEVAVQLVDGGSHPGTEATVTVALEDDAGDRSQATWRGALGTDPVDARVRVMLPRTAADADGSGSTARFAAVVTSEDGRVLIRVPGAVAVRRRISLEPSIIKASTDPGRVADCLLPGERVLASKGVGALVLHELTSGARIYSRDGAVVGVDAPMDDAFWSTALDAELRAYTGLHASLGPAATAARAESVLMRALEAGLGGKGAAAAATPLVEEAVALARAFDPERPDHGTRPKEGMLAPLGAFLADRASPPAWARPIAPAIRRALESTEGRPMPEGPGAAAGQAAGAAAGALERLAQLLASSARSGRFDERALEGAVALVAAAGVAGSEAHRLRAIGDPWAMGPEVHADSEAANGAMSSQLGALLGLLARHRARRSGAERNAALRAAHAAVARDLAVDASRVVGHSGETCEIALTLRNASQQELSLRLHLAMPSTAWALLDPPSRGSEGLASFGPVRVPAGGSARLDLVLYVPTTAKMDRYVLPLEVVPEPGELAPEQVGESP
jgi:uncharacterized membrane protein